MYDSYYIEIIISSINFKDEYSPLHIHRSSHRPLSSILLYSLFRSFSLPPPFPFLRFPHTAISMLSRVHRCERKIGKIFSRPTFKTMKQFWHDTHTTGRNSECACRVAWNVVIYEYERKRWRERTGRGLGGYAIKSCSQRTLRTRDCVYVP